MTFGYLITLFWSGLLDRQTFPGRAGRAPFFLSTPVGSGDLVSDRDRSTHTNHTPLTDRLVPRRRSATQDFRLVRPYLPYEAGFSSQRPDLRPSP